MCLVPALKNQAYLPDCLPGIKLNSTVCCTRMSCSVRNFTVDLMLVTNTLGDNRSAPFYAAGIARNGIIRNLHVSAQLLIQKSSRIHLGLVLMRGKILISTIYNFESTFEGVECLIYPSVLKK